MKTLVIDTPSSYGTPFMEYGEVTYDPLPSEDTVAAHDLVCFVGGNDVDPSMYKHHAYKHTGSDLLTDIPCKFAHQVATKLSIPIVGICKGSQQLWAFNGGSLFQHVDNHCVDHIMHLSDAIDFETTTITVTSSHHQMFDLESTPKIPYKLLGWSEQRSGTHIRYQGNTLEDVLELTREPEVVLFPELKHLLVQYHPEWMPRDSQGHRLFNQMIEEYLI